MSQVFHGRRQYGSSNLRVTLLIARRSHVARRSSENIYGDDRGAHSAVLISNLPSVETSSGPKIVYSTEMAAELDGIPGRGIHGFGYCAGRVLR